MIAGLVTCAAAPLAPAACRRSARSRNLERPSPLPGREATSAIAPGLGLVLVLALLLINPA